MTKQGGFKKAVREHARRTGQRYARARAELDGISRPFARTRPVDLLAVQTHLAGTYGIEVTSVLRVDDDPMTRPHGSWPGHYPSTLLVHRVDGPPWVARVFSSAADEVARAEGDVAILGFLAGHDYPAERPAQPDAVSMLDGAAVVVTDLLLGNRPTDEHGRLTSPEVAVELGELLGRLHALPPGTGAAARAGGAEEHDGGFGVGRPAQDLASAMRFLAAVEDDADPAARPALDWLRERVEAADDAEGLPESFTHSNFHAWSVVGTPGDLGVVGWAGSGRGPRLPALAWLLRTASEGGDAYVDAVVRGYRRHVMPTTQELDRLERVLDIRPLWLACLDVREAVRRGRALPPRDGEGYGLVDPARSARITDRVRATLRR